ncbi:MAG TPA: ATP-binding protein [Candidatus Gastranaerophilales bacterium]|nr:ATP-binding protein [Candidatus Gastranaerophilales bacterium]
MKNLLKPGIKLINRLKYPQKFGLISLLLILFISAFLFIINLGLDKKINLIKKERIGVEYIKPAKNILYHLEELRGFSGSYLEKHKEFQYQINKTVLFINISIDELKKINTKYNDLLKISGDLKSIEDKWIDLKKKRAQLNKDIFFDEYNIITQEILDLIIKISDNSNLTLDSEIITFYTIRSIQRDLPNLIDSLGIIKNIAVNALINKRLMQNEKEIILINSFFVKKALNYINDNSAKIFEKRKDFKEILEKYLSDVNKNSLIFLDMVSKEILNSNSITLDMQIFYNSAKNALDSSFELYEAKLILLDQQLITEIKDIEKLKYLILTASALGFIGLAYLFICFAFSIIDAIKYLENKALQIAEGDLSVEARLDTQDELKKLSDSINKMKHGLNSLINNEKTLRKITSEVSLFTKLDDIDNYLLNELLNIFDADKTLHLHLEAHSLYWYGKKTKEAQLELLKGQRFVPENTAAEITPQPDEILVYENVDEAIKNKYLKNCLQAENIKALIAYPTSKKIPGKEEKGIIEITMIASSTPKAWTTQEKEFFKLIMDTISIVSLETIQRNEIEEIRKAFIATLTHDLKSPIISEQKALEFLLSPKGLINKESYQEYLKDIYKINEDLLKLINNLLSVYHYESEKIFLQKTSENMKEIITEVVKSLQYLADDRDAELLLDIQENLPEIEVDRIEIKRIFSNIISNAIQHNDKGVIITIGALSADKEIQVFISDNGKGIPEEISSKIFNKYITQKNKIGSGLGLYISRQIVEAHGGEIWFKTQEGQGTTFYFTLPL